MASSGVGETVPGVHAETELGAPPSRRRVDIGSIINSRQRDMANTELKGQVKFFEDLIRRLSEELARSQAANPGGQAKPSSDSPPGFLDGVAEGTPLPLWLTDPKYLSPILVAYDKRLEESEAKEKGHLDEMVGLKEATELVVRENSHLRGDLEHHMALLAKKLEEDEVTAGMASTQQVLERLDLITEENNLLLQQQEELDSEISHLHKRLEVRTGEGVKLQRDLTGALSKLNRTEAELERAQEFAAEMRKRNKVQEERLAHADEEAERLKAELSASASQGGKMKKLLEEASNAYAMLQSDHAALQARDREVAGGAVGLSRELASLQERHKAALAEVEHARSESQQLRELLAGMEARVNEYQAKEVEVFQRIQEAQAAAEAAKGARDNTAARETALSIEVQDMQHQLRDVREQVSRRVEQAFKEANESVAAKMSAATSEIHSLQTQLAEARSAVERAEREARGAYAEREALQVQLSTGPEVPGLMRGHDARAEAEKLERERDEAREAARSAGLAMTRATQEWERERRALAVSASELQKHLDVTEAEAEEMRQQARHVRSLLEALQKEHRQLARDRAAGEHRLQQELDAAIAEHRAEMRILESKLEQAVALYNRASQEAEGIIDAKDSSLAKTQEESREAAVRFEQVTRDQAEALEGERARANALAAEVKKLTLDVAALEGDLHVAAEASKKALPRVESAERRAAEASAQVVALLTSEEDLLRQKKDLHAALDRMTLERARADRQRDQIQAKHDSIRRQLEAAQEAVYVGGIKGPGGGTGGSSGVEDVMRELERRAAGGSSSSRRGGERSERRSRSSRTTTTTTSVVRVPPPPIVV